MIQQGRKFAGKAQICGLSLLNLALTSFITGEKYVIAPAQDSLRSRGARDVVNPSDSRAAVLLPAGPTYTTRLNDISCSPACSGIGRTPRERHNSIDPRSYRYNL